MKDKYEKFSDNRIKHLEIVQNIITRMASNSFYLKGWSVTIISALFVIAQVESNQLFFSLALLPAITFWGLDSYYLRQERLFRKLYEDLIKDEPSEKIKPFSLVTSAYIKSTPPWFHTLFSKTEFWFHGVIIALIIISIILGPNITQKI